MHKTLVLVLERALLADPLDELLVEHRDGFAAPEPLRDTSALIARLGALKAWSRERGMLLAGLLRLHRQRPVAGVRIALLYGVSDHLTPEIGRHVAAGHGDALLADLYVAVADCAESVDPDLCPDAVEKVLVGAIERSLRRVRRANWRVREAGRRAEARLTGADRLLAERELTLADVLERRPRKAAPDDGARDTHEEESILRELVEDRTLSPRDAELIERKYLRGEPIAVAAKAMGLQFEAATKALYRARQRVHENRARIVSRENASDDIPKSGGLIDERVSLHDRAMRTTESWWNIGVLLSANEESARGFEFVCPDFDGDMTLYL